MSNSVQEFYSFLVQELKQLYTDEEITFLVSWLLEERLNIKKGNLPFYFDYPLPLDVHKVLLSDLERLKNGEPIQYIIGKTYFLDLEIKVTSSVLIPRPETEELVSKTILYLRSQKNIQRILEVGTGSGNIAIALAKYLPWINVVTIDIDSEALALAKENAIRHGVDKQIEFLCQDIRKYVPRETYDFLISNPPYVPLGAWVASQVKQFEPSHAVFTSDDEGLEFYKVFYHFFQNGIVKQGVFEIYEDNAERLKKLFADFSVKIEEDMAGKPRFLWVKKSCS